jgi:hypothetical protein
MSRLLLSLAIVIGSLLLLALGAARPGSAARTVHSNSR